MAMLSIAIDGPAGAGKSTLSKALAQDVGFLYVDTGAIYRTVGLFVARQGKTCSDPAQVEPLLPQVGIEMVYGKDGQQRMFLNGEDVTEAIRENQVSQYASQVSALPAVRTFLLDMQRDLARAQNVVMDGRDIGTVVLPHADLKVFLTASLEARARRRHQELAARGTPVAYETLLAEMRERDEADRSRPVAPLRQAADAVVVDTSALTLDQSLEALRRLVKERLHV